MTILFNAILLVYLSLLISHPKFALFSMLFVQKNVFKTLKILLNLSVTCLGYEMRKSSWMTVTVTCPRRFYYFFLDTYIPLASSPLIYMFFSTHNAKTATLRYIYVFVDLRDLRRFIFCKMHTQAYCNDSQFWLKVDMKPKNETYINLIGKLQPAFDWGIICMQYAAHVPACLTS